MQLCHMRHFGWTQNWLQWWAHGTLWLDSELVAVVGTWDTLAGLRIGCSGGHRGHFGWTQNWLQWCAQGTLWLDSFVAVVGIKTPAVS